MSDRHKIAAAEIEVEKTRAALLETANELIERFQPHNLVDDLWESAKIKGADLAEDAVDAVAKRPVAIGGMVAALAMFLAREPIKKATVKFYDAMTPLLEPRAKKKAAQKPAKPAVSKAKETAPKPAKPPVRRKTRTSPRAAAKKTENA